MEKIVLPGERVTTVTLDGSECAVKFSRPFRAFSVRNDGDTDICIALESGKSAGDDGVVCVPSGASDTYFHGRQLDTCYLLGAAGGKVTVKAQDTDCNSFHKKGKGGDKPEPTVKKQSPASLGYASQGAFLFYDGIYNAGYAHENSRASSLIWYDLVGNYCVSRDDGSVTDNCYIKGNGDAYVFYIPKSLLTEAMNKSIFTFEIAFKITSIPNTSEQIIAGDQTGETGFNIATMSGKFVIGHGKDFYNTDIPTEKTTVQMVYDGTLERIYINGKLAREQETIFPTSTIKELGIGGWGNSRYSESELELYRVAFYEEALTADEILNNYSRDAARFGYKEAFHE